MRQKKMDVSIIIINYNTKKLTKACIESIYNYTQGVRFEVIVIDNASTDGSEHVLAKLPFRNYQYICHGKNIGFSKANNLAALYASGEYLFFMNSDMVFISDVVSILFHRIQNDGQVGIIGPKFENPDGSDQVSCRNFPSILFGLSRFFPFLKYFLSRQILAYYQKERDYTVEQSVDTVSAGALMISRKLFEKTGRFDEFSFMYAEDADICRQIRDSGYKVVFFPEAKLIHFGGQSSQLNSYRAIWSYYFAFYYLYKKYYFGKMAVCVKPLFFVRALMGVTMNFFKKDKRVTWNDK